MSDTDLQNLIRHCDDQRELDDTVDLTPDDETFIADLINSGHTAGGMGSIDD